MPKSVNDPHEMTQTHDPSQPLSPDVEELSASTVRMH